MRVRIDRHESSDQGTFGRIYFGDHNLFTGELPDRGNSRNRSRIPEGTYEVDWTFSPLFKRFMYLITDVPQRSGIRIHSANFMGDKSKGLKCQLYGCIALGERLGYMDEQKAVLLSRPAVSKLESFLRREPFTLEINSVELSW